MVRGKAAGTMCVVRTKWVSSKEVRGTEGSMGELIRCEGGGWRGSKGRGLQVGRAANSGGGKVSAAGSTVAMLFMHVRRRYDTMESALERRARLRYPADQPSYI